MSSTAQRRMTVDEVLAWQCDQAQNYELVNGVPRAMTGARFEHDRITANLLRSLGNAFRAVNSPCDAFTYR